MPVSTVTLAAIQVAPVFLNLQASLEKAEQAVRRAADAGVHVAGFAECWLTGYPVWLDFADKAARWGEAGTKDLYGRLFDEAVDLAGDVPNRLQELANETNVVIAMGTHERRGGTLTNTAMTFTPGAEAPTLRRKLVPTYTERLVWGRGDGATLSAAQTPFGAVSTLICWEHWMPLARAATHAQHPALHVSQWPVVSEPHLLASRHIAFEGRLPVIAAGSILHQTDILEGYRSGATTPAGLAMLESMTPDQKGLIHRGGSTLVGPNGSLLQDQVWDREDIVIAEVDLAAAQQDRITLDVAGHYSRPDVFELQVNTRPQPGVRFTGAP